MWTGASWYTSLTLHGVAEGTVESAALWINGREYPVIITDTLVWARLDREQVAEVPGGAPAQLYLDLKDVGRVLWLHGNVVRGGKTK